MLGIAVFYFKHIFYLFLRKVTSCTPILHIPQSLPQYLSHPIMSRTKENFKKEFIKSKTNKTYFAYLSPLPVQPLHPSLCPSHLQSFWSVTTCLRGVGLVLWVVLGILLGTSADELPFLYLLAMGTHAIWIVYSNVLPIV